MANDKLKIVFLMNALGCGGAERVAISYANWLVSNTNNDVYFLTFENQAAAYDVDQKVKIMSMPNYNKKNRLLAIFKRYEFCKKSFKKIRPNIIFAMFYQTQIYAYLAKSRNVLLIGSERCNMNVNSFLGRTLSKFIAKKCNGFIFQTTGMRKYFPSKVQENSIVIPNAVSNADVYNLKKTKKGKIIIGIGRLTYQKGFDVLIKAFARINTKHPDYILQIYGEGIDQEKLQNLINELGINKQAQLMGVSNNIIKKLASSEIFVLSSRFEGMPNALIEAMASGTACIATNCDFGPRDLIIDGDNGLLIPVDNEEILAEKINFLIENKKVRKKYETNAISIREELKPYNIYSKYYNYFLEILEKNKKKRK